MNKGNTCGVIKNPLRFLLVFLGTFFPIYLLISLLVHKKIDIGDTLFVGIRGVVGIYILSFILCRINLGTTKTKDNNNR